MKRALPEKARHTGRNLIRDVFERGAGIPGFISFGIGNPAPEAIPVELIRDTVCEVISDNTMEYLQYGPMNGDAHLAGQIRKRLVDVKGFPTVEQSVLISVGSGQCLGLVPRTLCDVGDEVYMERFTFTSGIHAVRNAGATAVPIASDDDGMIPEALEAAAKSGKGRYIYLIPNFQNPTGITMSETRRKEIYDIASRYDLYIYEDDPYGEIRFAGEPVPAFKSFDVDNRVIYAGSYSKTLSAGLRVGFLYGPADIIEAIQLLKNNSDGQMPLLTQRVVSRVLDTIDYEAQIAKTREIYGRKCRLLRDTLIEKGSSKVKYTNPEGGMFLWMTLPEGADSDAFFEACIAEKVGIVTGAAFAVDPADGSNAFRLSYTVPTEEEILVGAAVVAETTKRFFGE